MRLRFKLRMSPVYVVNNSKIFKVLLHSDLLVCLLSAFEVLKREITYVNILTLGNHCDFNIFKLNLFKFQNTLKE